LEEQVIGVGTVTTHGLREMIRNVMGDVLVEAGVQSLQESMIKLLLHLVHYLIGVIDQYLHLSSHFQNNPH
jgi:hypothetical protein